MLGKHFDALNELLKEAGEVVFDLKSGHEMDVDQLMLRRNELQDKREANNREAKLRGETPRLSCSSFLRNKSWSTSISCPDCKSNTTSQPPSAARSRHRSAFRPCHPPSPPYYYYPIGKSKLDGKKT